MTKDSQGNPIEEEGGYGTPTVEQEMGGADTKKSNESAAEGGGVAAPSADAETDESNTEDSDAG